MTAAEHTIVLNGFQNEGGIYQVGQYKSTNTDAGAGTKAQILTQSALPGFDIFRTGYRWSEAATQEYFNGRYGCGCCCWRRSCYGCC
jgi:hypothetical protein